MIAFSPHRGIATILAERQNYRTGLSISALSVRRHIVRALQPQEYTMAQYVVLIYENESDYATASPEVFG